RMRAASDSSKAMASSGRDEVGKSSPAILCGALEDRFALPGSEVVCPLLPAIRNLSLWPLHRPGSRMQEWVRLRLARYGFFGCASDRTGCNMRKRSKSQDQQAECGPPVHPGPPHETPGRWRPTSRL